MKELDNILNQIGYFQCKTQDRTISITGILVQEQDGIIFRGSTCIENLRSLESFNNFQMWGKSNEIPLTLLNCWLKTMSTMTGGMHVSIVAEPSEIIIGYSYIGNIVVKHIETSIDALNYMFTENPLKVRYDFTRDSPAVINYTYPDKIKTHDKYGHLLIYQSFSLSIILKVNIINFKTYHFPPPTRTYQSKQNIILSHVGGENFCTLTRVQIIKIHSSSFIDGLIELTF